MRWKIKEFISKKIKEIFGTEFELSSIERLYGGAQKHTYLAKCTNGFEFVIYKWDKSRKEKDYEYDFVEYINGKDMDYIMENEPERLPDIIASLYDSVHIMHSIKSNAVGQVARMQNADFDIIEYTLKGIHQNSIYIQENDIEYKDIYIQVEQQAKTCHKKLKKGRNTHLHMASWD